MQKSTPAWKKHRLWQFWLFFSYAPETMFDSFNESRTKYLASFTGPSLLPFRDTTLNLKWFWWETIGERGGATKKHHGIPIKKDQNFRYLCRWRPLCTSRIVRTTIGALSPVNIFSSWQSKRPAQRSRPTCIVKEISNLYLISIW